MPTNTLRVSSASASFAPPRKRFQHNVRPFAPMLVLDAEGTIQHVTMPARRLLEYDGRQHVDPCFFSHVHGKSLYQVMRDVADMVCYGKTRASWLLRMQTGAGRWRWYQATAQNDLSGADPAIVVQLKDMNA